jgi:hypothetical protein
MDTATDIDLWHYARPLPPDRRDEFCQAAESALSRLRCPGPGVIHRTLAKLLPDYFIPIADDRPHQHRRPSKLTSAAPLA